MTEETRSNRNLGKATAELDGVLARRRVIVEGQNRAATAAAVAGELPSNKPRGAVTRQPTDFSTNSRPSVWDYPFRGVVPLYEIESSRQLEQKVRAVTLSNEQLSTDVDRIMERLNEIGWHDHGEVLLVENENLLAATDQAGLHNGAVSTQDLFEKNGALSKQTNGHPSAQQEKQRLEAELSLMRQENLRLDTELKRACEEAEIARGEFRGLREDRDRLQMAAATGSSVRLAQHDRQVSSESKLRTALTDRATTTSELKEAIGAVDALVSEAKRELAQRQLRERRAAFEALHIALEKGDEHLLVEALDASRRSEVDLEDIEKGEAKLRELRELTQEQRAAKEKRALESKMKKEVFLLVKKDDATGLGTLLEGLDESLRWQDWKDYAGRSMWRCAQELRATRVQRYLAPLLGMHLPQERQSLGRKETWQGSSGEQGVSSVDEPSPTSGLKRQSGTKSPKLTIRSPTISNALPTDVFPLPDQDLSVEDASGTNSFTMLQVSGSGGVSPVGAPQIDVRLLSQEEEADVRAKAFRAVAQDDCQALTDLLDGVPLGLWSAWQNKAGKDLMTLSEERGSCNASTLLAKALGLIVEQKREKFEESETVWVYLFGDVQPKRANVLEDTAEDVDDILIQYWDGDDEPERVPRDSVRKMLSVNS